MSSSEQSQANLNEVDGRFPSGPWQGYFLQRPFPGRQWMNLQLTFCQGAVTGTGRDWIGLFLIRGQYDLDDGRCPLVKRYTYGYDVTYKGYNEGNGIWGVWELDTVGRGGFHIWPEGKSPDDQARRETAIEPVFLDEFVNDTIV